MPGERATLTEAARSRRLPPLEAWKKPDKWIDLSTGFARRDAPRLVFETDDRGFVQPDALVHQVNEVFFWPDYDWPYDPDDPQTKPDKHHFYFDREFYTPEQNQGSDIPMRFRELPVLIGLMPRQFHNTFHDFTVPPTMPEMEHMEHFLDSYYIAHRAFKRLYESARKTVMATQQFSVRRQSVGSGLILPSSGKKDEIGEEFLRSFFDRNFRTYSLAIELFKAVENKELIYQEYQKIEQARLKKIVKELGGVVNRQHLNFMPILRAA